MTRVPQFPLYSADFLVGTGDMTQAEVGQYVRLLCWMHQKGPLTADQMTAMEGPTHVAVIDKFVNVDGKYMNKRLLEEIAKYERWRESRIENLKGGKNRTKDPPHMGDYMDKGDHKDSDSDNSSSFIKLLLSRFDS